MTKIILDDEDNGGGLSKKPDGSCLTLFVLLIGISAHLIGLFR